MPEDFEAALSPERLALLKRVYSEHPGIKQSECDETVLALLEYYELHKTEYGPPRRKSRGYGSMTDRDEERIESAAIRVGGRIFTLPPPARHHNVMRTMYEDHGFKELVGEEQGFVTSYGRF